MRTHKIAGVVLCGGRSSRMGSDKSRLRYRGLPLQEHMSGLLRAAGLDHVFTSGPGGITDVLPELGPLGGIYSSICKLAGRYSHAVFVPVDMPLLNPLRIRDLILHDGAAEALHYAGQNFPLRLALTAQTRGSLDELVMESGANGRSIRNLIKTLYAESLPVQAGDLESFVNINTPQDWRSLTVSPGAGAGL